MFRWNAFLKEKQIDFLSKKTIQQISKSGEIHLLTVRWTNPHLLKKMFIFSLVYTI